MAKASELTIQDDDVEVAVVGCGEMIDQLRDPERYLHSVKAGGLQVWVHLEFDTLRESLKRAEGERDAALEAKDAALAALKRATGDAVAHSQDAHAPKPE